MSSANPSHCVCPTPEVINVPGAPGTPGTPGLPGMNGSDGINPFTLVAGAGFTVPAVNSPVSGGIPVLTSVWAVIGQVIFVQGGGYYQVNTIPGTANIAATRLAVSGYHTYDGASVSAGAGVGPAGVGVLVPGITAFTDNSTGAVSSTIAAGVGVSTLAFQIDAATISATDIMITYLPGYAFKILAFDARCNQPVTTGGHNATVSLKITGSAVTGGSIALSGTYAIGVAQAGSTVTAANTGSATDTISINAASVSAFIEGSFMFYIRIQNMDTANAFASIASKFNAFLTDLG